MGKKTVYTKITPLPRNVPRQLAVDMLHSHTEIIELNPLVTGVRPVEAPRDAASDEFFSQWYEITEIITWGFGIKKKISFKGVFHDQPWGLQTHVYAPMGVDMRNKYRIGGNQPGEPREAKELGLDIPTDGLYLREDVEITCAVPLTASFVKKEAKAATAVMVERLTRKAELLDEGKLHAMFENGRLKTMKPNPNPTYGENPLPSPVSPGSPSTTYSNPNSPNAVHARPVTDEKGYARYSDIIQNQASQSRPTSDISPHANPPPPGPHVFEVAGSMYHSQNSAGLYPPPLHPHGPAPVQQFRAELPGDTNYQHATTGPTHEQPSQQQQQQQQHQYVSYHPAYAGPTSTNNDEKVAIEPDHARLQRMSLKNSPPSSTSPALPDRTSRCPVCDKFVGDAAAVTHHVEKSHFL